MFIGSSLAASSVFTSGGFSLQIIKAKVLEVGDKLLIYIQRAEWGNLSPWERQLCSQPEVNQAAAAVSMLLRGLLLLAGYGKYTNPIITDYHPSMQTRVSLAALDFFFFFNVKLRDSSHPAAQNGGEK